MSSFTEQEVVDILNRARTDEEDKGAWVILINNKRFKTSGGKSVWKAKNHASTALNMELKTIVKSKMRQKLVSEGADIHRVYLNKEYKNSFSDFKEIAINSGYLEIKQINY